MGNQSANSGKMMSRMATPLAVLLLAGCASTYGLTLMPRNSGTLYHGEAVERGAGSDIADVTVTIDKTYTGTWQFTAPDRSNAYVTGGIGFGRRSGLGLGTIVSVDNPYGGEAKALLRGPDGSGLRCDFRGLVSGRGGGGTCQDDKGLVYDVQIRVKE
jgi:hypothetical protein